MTPFDLSYEVDLWGRVRRSFESAQAQSQASLADFENVLLGLNSDVAVDYFALRTLDVQIKVQRESIQARQKELDLTKSRFVGGINTELDVQLAQAELATTQSQLGALQQSRAELEHALAVLVGDPPEGFTLAEDPLDMSPPHIPAGVPSDLLERRPDVAEAERKAAAQNAQIGVAIAAYYPVVRLTGDTGLDSGDISTLINWQSRVWAIGPSIYVPLFEGGEISANVRKQKAAYEEQVADYRQQVLVAFRDVEDSLSDLRYLAQQEEAQNRAFVAYQKTLALTNDRYTAGLVSYFDVTTAERDLLDAEQTLVQIKGNRMGSTVRLIKALGGGWADEPLLSNEDAHKADGPPHVPSNPSTSSNTMP
jgi:multidrug efflux system outer membrane protein